MQQRVAIFIAIVASASFLAGCNVDFTAPLPQSSALHDTRAYVGTWELFSFWDHTYSNDLQVIIRTELNSNGVLRATMTENKQGEHKTIEMPEVNFYRIGKHVYLGSPSVRITTDSLTNTVYLHTIKYSTVTNHIATGILTGTVTEWDHSYIVKVESTTKELEEYLLSGDAQFTESPTIVLKRK